MVGQTLFHKILAAIAGGLTSTTAVEWNLRLKDIEYNVCLTKKYCITVSMQKINSINTLNKQVIGSHEVNGHFHFWPCSSKNLWNNFYLSWICTSMQKISSFHQFILEIQSILESLDQTGHNHFWPCAPKIFLINF